MNKLEEYPDGPPKPPKGYRILRPGEPWEGRMFLRHEDGDLWPFAVQIWEPDHAQWYYAVPETSSPFDDPPEYHESFA